ncbi:uncharacterized protein LOC141537277 [Cotesia typhae]|uniref:uncharacterized protein LOC141537277 n=1 Tax=Cotesia typhae TaxID=2053667 RepID=UPI003D699061
MTIFVLVRDKKQDYCVHKKRHISIERQRDRICRKKIKIICEHGSLTDGVKKHRMLEKKTSSVLKYTVENCRINLKKIKNVHFFDSKSDTINNDSDSASKTLNISSNLYEISDKSFETIDPANISHLIENGSLDNFISDMDSIEIGQKVTIDSENIQESNSLGFDIQQELSNDTTSIQLENINKVDELEYQRTINANENGLESASNDNTQKNSQIESSFEAETQDSDSSYEPADSERSIENEEYLVDNVTEDENSDSENIGSRNVEECNNVSQNTSTSTLNCSFNVNGHAGWDDNDVEAELTMKKGNLKKDTCCFCEREYFKIARHLETVHKTEREVQDFMKLEKKSASRMDQIALLRKRGNHMFNMKQRKKADGTPGLFKVARCPNKTSKKGGGNYAVCSKCKGWYTKNNIRHHYRDCQNGAKSSKGILARARRIQGQIHERASDAMRYKIIPYMKLTENVKLIRYDLMIILFGNEECTKYKKRNLAQMIRAKLSLLARFLVVMKDVDSSVSDFASIYTPERYYKVIEAINKFAGLEEETGFYKVPSRASEITTNINKIGQIFINECIINKDRIKKEDVENFLSLCKQGFANIINRTVNETHITQ